MDIVTKARIVVTVLAFIIILFVSYVMYVNKMKKIQAGKKNKKKNTEIRIMEVQYLYYKHKIVKERLYTKKFALLFSFINSLIICATFLTIELLPWHFGFRMLLGFAMLLGFIYSIYGIIGTILVKRGYKNER